jgi:hypothetical protein
MGCAYAALSAFQVLENPKRGAERSRGHIADNSAPKADDPFKFSPISDLADGTSPGAGSEFTYADEPSWTVSRTRSATRSRGAVLRARTGADVDPSRFRVSRALCSHQYALSRVVATDDFTMAAGAGWGNGEISPMCSVAFLVALLGALFLRQRVLMRGVTAPRHCPDRCCSAARWTRQDRRAG